MKFRFLISATVVVALFVLSSYTIDFSGRDKQEVLVQAIMNGVKYLHYQPQTVDDAFSNRAFDDYLKRLDYNKRYLTQRDVDNLGRFRYRIDDEIKTQTFELFELSVGIWEKRKDEAKGYVDEILAEPFDFAVKEELDTDVEHMRFASSGTEVKERWRKALKYETLTQMVRMMERQEKAEKDGDADFERMSPAAMEEKARAKVVKNYERYFKRMDRQERNDWQAQYMNTIASLYDPHTSYFPPKEQKQFDIDMSGRLEGIGAQLSERDGYIKVVSIVPGSASDLQGELEVNDKIVKVAQGNDEPVSIVDMGLDDAIWLIRGKKGTKVRLTVQKIDGKETEIPIIRDVVVMEETYAKSSVLQNGPDGEKVGYIHLPKFYGDMQNRKGRQCSRDVANEIKKLEAEGVDGIILDLRGNGGGYLYEVVDMVGLFIESGPVVQVKNRDGSTRVHGDRDPKIQYDGELIVMVNSFSASASEILAAAIQDYDRGLIVGSPSTYGKGTVQRMVNLDDFVRGESPEIKPLGSIKLTIQKYYRVNGGATQLKGVTPDIILPDDYSLLDLGEKEYDYPIAWDEIEPTSYETWAQPVSAELTALQMASKARVDANETFGLVKQNAIRLKRNRDKNSYPLQLEAYREYRKQNKEESDRFKEIRKPIDGFKVGFPEVDMSYISEDSTRIKRYEDWRKELEKDPYLFETVQIMTDFTEESK